MPVGYLLAVLTLICNCCDTALSAELREEAECTSAVLSADNFQVVEEDVLGVLGGEMSFYCCQRRSSCEHVSQARYFFNGSPINTSDVAKYNTRNEDGARLIVLDLAPADQGRYTCACPGGDLPPKDPEDEGVVLLFLPQRQPVFPYRVEEGTTALVPCPLSLLLDDFITNYKYRWEMLDGEDTIERVLMGAWVLSAEEEGRADGCSNASVQEQTCSNGTLRISNVSSEDAQRQYQCVITGFQREGRDEVPFHQSPTSEHVPLVLIKSLDLRVHLSSGVLKAGGSITAQCQSASGRNLSLAAEVTINGIPVTEKDGYRLELTNRDSSGVAVCEAVQQGNNSIDLNETASAPFTAVDIPRVAFQSADVDRLIQRFSLTHSAQTVTLSVEFIVSNADSAQTHFLSRGQCAPPIIQGSSPVLIPNALPPGMSSAVVEVDLPRALPQLNLDNVMLFVQFRLVLDGVRGGCSLTAPLREPCPPAVSLFLVAAATGVVVVLVTLAVTIPLTVCITLWCKKRCGKGRDRLGRNTQTREYHKGDVGIVNDAEGEVEGSSDEKSALLHHEEH